MKRRHFVSNVARTLGLLAAAGGFNPLPGNAASLNKAGSEVQKAREKLLREMEANLGIAVPREDGEFLHLMVHVTTASEVLEVGAFRGYSGIWMGMALEQTGGRLTTIEIDPERVRESKANFQKAGLAGRITSLQGDAHQVAKTVHGPFDLVFLDAEKGGEIDYFNTVFPKLRPGGFLLVHNAIMFKTSMRPYLEMVSKHPEILHVLLSLTLKDGFSVSYRKQG